ncbi:MAG: hypothetical protein ACYC5Y_05005 [Symbiobacteriia bacterium]
MERPMNVRLIPGNHLGAFALVAPPPNVCQECAVEHDPEMPHNQQSLFFQYKFFNAHGRWPTWADAMAHCAPEMQTAWREALEARGVDVGNAEVADDAR